jgi:hypothetical protein
MPFPSDTCSWVERQGSIFFQEWTKKAQLCGLRKMAFSTDRAHDGGGVEACNNLLV